MMTLDAVKCRVGIKIDLRSCVIELRLAIESVEAAAAILVAVLVPVGWRVSCAPPGETR
jgi:hypothetical protein